MDPRQIHIRDYDYVLPDERIAKFPVTGRDGSRLLVYEHGKVGQDVFTNLPVHLPSGVLMVFNNTKVIQARLHFRKETGALIEVFLLEPYSPTDYEQMFQSVGQCSWLCLVGNSKRWKNGTLTRTISVGGRYATLTATRQGEMGTGHIVTFECDDPLVTFGEVLESVGELPIPPYLNRAAEESDKHTYQTVYSKVQGSVAAPTAGLHFTDRVLSSLDAHGVERVEVTLHVGAGTFRPVKSDDMQGHEMHTEHFCVPRQVIERLLAHDAKAVAVGTTSVRTLESLYYIGLRLAGNPDLDEEQLHIDQWEPYDTAATLSPSDALGHMLNYLERRGLSALHSSTQIIIAPGYDYKIVSALVTNFHQPQSTLLLLVAALIGDDWRKVYDYAMAEGFRFLSYGDSSLLIP